MRILSLVLIAIITLPSCIVLGGASAGALVAAEILADTPHIAHVKIDVDNIWPATVDNLTELGATELKLQNYPRVIEANVYDVEVFIRIEAYDIDHTVIRLLFRKNGFIDNTTAEHLLSELINRYEFNEA